VVTSDRDREDPMTAPEWLNPDGVDPSEPDDYDEDAEHDAWHPHWIEGCDACIDRADRLEERHLEAVPDAQR
jgi:hypothetical protein